MSDKLVHLVRHGEVHNPDRLLYGRLPGFLLSPLGERMAAAAAQELVASDRQVARILASPLERAQQSALPIAEAFNLPIITDERVIEPSNLFEGCPRRVFRQPRYLHRLVNPLRPSWGEAYRSIAQRAREAMTDAWEADRDGDVVIVSHQAVIWVAHRDIGGQLLAHHPARRRCELSSITSFERRGQRWFEVDYRTPAAGLLPQATDAGAV